MTEASPIEGLDEIVARNQLQSCGCCGESSTKNAGRKQGLRLLECTGCGTLRFEAIFPPDFIYKDGYHLGNSHFGWNYASEDERAYREDLGERTLEWLETYRTPGTLADVGGGLGYFASAAKSRGWDAEVIDPVAHAVEYAKSELGVRATRAGAEILAERPGVYDLIAYLHCIEHIPPAKEILEASREALRPGGVIFIEVPNHGSMARRLQGESWFGWRAGEHVYIFDKRSLRGLVERAGFEVLKVRSFVPGWERIQPAGYAHFIGLQSLLYSAVQLKHGIGRSNGSTGHEASDNFREPVSIDKESGIRRLIYKNGFDLIARAEDALGVGTNLQLVARAKK